LPASRGACLLVDSNQVQSQTLHSYRATIKHMQQLNDKSSIDIYDFERECTNMLQYLPQSPYPIHFSAWLAWHQKGRISRPTSSSPSSQASKHLLITITIAIAIAELSQSVGYRMEVVEFRMVFFFFLTKVRADMSGNERRR
jgi:hypothetical protein